ncbi:hypothetical protein ABID81_001422 [Frigoribacterium sp. PvP054]|jgi:hypothetical protein|uniref:hypothetical protein n=1 Tax=Frigoribacterium sp. PvP054 TaxID=3156438 RepID=UPI00339894F8
MMGAGSTADRLISSQNIEKTAGRVREMQGRQIAPRDPVAWADNRRWLSVEQPPIIKVPMILAGIGIGIGIVSRNRRLAFGSKRSSSEG